MKSYKTVSDYLKDQPAKQRAMLLQMRASIKKLTPKAEEKKATDKKGF